ncbi:two-partner secretion domain-containing protein [Sedimenticola selenatireducens]|uniref:Filamentous hemagglutinin N-terminal domain-containing protein n=1 Tax=Sedimenticola selenatireducens TaxID=191960 RepID=A0A557S1G6_9GAMM|nr:hemagglutinin repeat-containing protein [Sedimenticola selenatireducens]TVO71265.1 filamentous hemagglutinin N-terminal domain-containing protein [Sedimenticola selenatireducens]TVT61567.1 MAG: filamentous hemagglutinin N-terminal domain-containing protein [Sedimenticola selenatireducens]
MNKHRYRLVFNKARGLWMAVAEIVKACGKAASPVVGSTPKRSDGRSLQCVMRPLRLALLAGWGGLLVAQPLQAEIMADPTAAAGQRPEVTQAANGVTQVNIQRPGASGVSHNIYQRFDVDTSGAVLNNARVPVKTNLAGWVNGNPSLVGGTARIILNEVNSADPSVLRGYLEVAGDRAQVIVANPAGITCSGCGFINATRSTLTTGRPQFDNGSLSGFDINAGEIRIEGDGLDGRQSDYTDLLARAVIVNAGIWANELNLVTGSNRVAVDGSLQQTKAGSGMAPAFALDVKALGGMYAGKITLVGTENGVGVRNAGQIGAPAGQLQLSADGRLENQGVLAAQDLHLQMTDDIDNSGILSAERDLQLTTQATFDNQGTLYAVHDAVLNAGTGLTNRQDSQGLGGVISSGHDLQIIVQQTGARLDNQTGAVLAAGIEVDGTQGSTGSLRVNVNGAFLGQGRQSAAEQLTLQATSLTLDNGQTRAGAIQLQASQGDISNKAGELYADDRLAITADTHATQTLDNSRGKISAGQLQISVGQLSNVDSELVNTDSADSRVTVAGTLDNQRGLIASNSQNLAVQSGRLDNSLGSLAHAGTGTLGLQFTTLQGSAGTLASNGQLTISATTLTLDDATTSAQVMAIQAGQFSHQRGSLVANAGASVQAVSVDNRNGLMAARQDDLTLTSGGLLQNGQGRIESGNALQLTSGILDNQQGELLGDFVVVDTQQQAFDNQAGKVVADQTLTVNSGALNNQGGLLQSGSAMVVDTHGQRLDNSATATSGGLNSQGTLTLRSGDLNNQAGYLGASGALAIQAAAVDNRSQGVLLSEQQLGLTGASLDNRQGAVQSKGNQNLNLSGTLNNQAGSLLSEAQLTLQADVLDNRSTQSGVQGLQAKSATVSVSRLQNDAGRLLVDQALQITANNRLDNVDGQLSAGQTLLVTTARLDNTRGSVQSGDQLTLTATDLVNANTQTGRQGLQAERIDLAFVNLDNRQGRLLANRQLTLRGNGQLDNRNGLLSSQQALQVSDSQSQRTLRVQNQQGRLVSGTQLQLSSYSIQGDGELLALGDINLSLSGGLSHQGDLITNGDLNIALAGDLSNSGKLAAAGTLTLAAVNIDNLAGSEISAPINFIQANGTLSNQGLIDGSQTRIVAGTLDNFGTGRIYGNQLAIQAATLNNRDHNQRAAVIASRGDLDLGITTLENRNGALIFSAGDLRIGGMLDANDRATGKAGQLNNRSAGIETLGKLAITATQLLNQDTVFRIDTLHTLVDEYHRELRWVNSEDYYERTYLRNGYEEVIGASDPGRLLSAGDMTLNIDQITNDKSHILAGGTLTLNAVQVDNLNATLEKRQEDVGQERFSWIEYCRLGKSKCRRYTPYTPYQPPAQITTIPVTLARVEQQGSVSVNDPGLTAHQPDSTHPTLASADSNTDSAQGMNQTPGPQQSLQLTAQAVNQSGTNSPQVVRSGGLLVQLPNNALFNYQTSPQHSVLIETDPRFADYRHWLSSNYMLDQLGLDPANVMKRLGDGFYEQRLVQQQITQLTGQRYLAGYQSDEEQFKALMNAGVTFALAYDLTPGLALTTEQMAHLTSDLVWLVEQTVVLSDGSRHSVLVPQLYAVLEPGDINGQGALLGGEQVALNLSGDLLNQGSVQAVDRLNLSAVNIHNRRGSFSARSTELSATQDIDNQAGLMQGRDRLVVQAGRDFTVRAATREGFNQVGDSQFERIHLDGIGTLQVLNPEGQLAASAGRDLTLTSAAVINEGENGTTELSAGRNLQLETTQTRMRDAMVWDSRNYRTEDLQREIGTAIQTEGDLTFSAGKDLTARAAQISSNGHLRALAEGNIAIDHGINTDHNARRQVINSKGFLSSKTTIDESRSTTRSVQGSLLSAQDITLQAGQNLTVSGSQVVATESVNLNAGGDLTIQSGQQTSDSYSYHQKKRSGLLTGGSGFGITIGKMQKSDQVEQRQVTQVSSTVGALNGDVTLNAGQDVTVKASDLLARQGNIHVEGANITLDSADDTLGRQEAHKFKQSGLTLAISGGIVDTLQTIKSSVERIDSTEDSRLKALHAWRIGRIAKNLPDQFDKLDHLDQDIANPTQPSSVDGEEVRPSSGINLSLSLGSSASEQQISQRSQTALGSSLIADQQIQITARGRSGTENPGSPEEELSGGDINLRGALLEADQITLNAANELNLTSAENHNDYTETSKSKSSGIGISIGSDGLLFFVEGSRSRGLVNQSDDRYLETLINAKEKATLISASDTTLQGAQVNAKRIEVNSGGDLNIISQQDKEHFKKRTQSIGGRIGIGYGRMSVSINASKLKADSDYVAVQEQSGLFAGEGGFDVQVAQHTDLQGGAIVSEAEPDYNRFSTDTLSYNAIDNHAKYDVESKSISFSTSGGLGGGFSDDSGEAQNTTYAAISDGDITVRSNPGQSLDEIKRSREEAHQVLGRIFSEEMVQQMQEEVEFTQLLSEEGPKAIGDYADSQLKAANELRHRADSAEASERDTLNAEADRIEANWKENGHLRIALHAFVGGLGNGLEGVVGAGITASAIPHIDGLLEKSGVSKETRKAILIAASAGVGGLVGGQPGALASMGQTVNNYLSHLEATRLNELKKHLLTCEADCNIDAVRAEIKALEGLDRHRDEYARIVCALPTSAACGQVIGQMQAFREGYLAAGPLSMLSRQKTESTQLAEQLFTYRQRAANPEIYNTVKGVGTSIGAGIEGTLDLGLLAGNAALGDEQSQAMLVQLAAATKAFLAHPVDNTEKAIKTKLDEIDRLEKSGQTDLAHQKRAELYTSGAFTITGAGALAITGGKVVIAGSKLAVSGSKALVTSIKNVAGSAADKFNLVDWRGLVGDTWGKADVRVLFEATTLTQQRELAKLTNQARHDLVNDFNALFSELSPNQIDAIVENPWTMQLFFGTAVETRVARQVRVAQSRPDSVFEGMKWTERTNAPQDFINPDGFGFDITGSSTTSIFKHQTRPEVNTVITYDSIPNDLGYKFIGWLENN